MELVTKQTPMAPPVSRRGFLSGTAALAAAALLAPTAGATGAVDPLAGLLGRFRHVGGEAERAAVREAIEAVVREMSALARPIARARLLEANPVPDTLALRSDGKLFTIAYAEESFTAPLDGTPAHVRTHDGDEMDLRVRVDRATVRQMFSADDKARTNLLRIEGGKLAVYVQVKATSLPRELVYRLTYEPVR